MGLQTKSPGRMSWASSEAVIFFVNRAESPYLLGGAEVSVLCAKRVMPICLSVPVGSPVVAEGGKNSDSVLFRCFQIPSRGTVYDCKCKKNF